MYPDSPFPHKSSIEIQIFVQNEDKSNEWLKWICSAPETTTYRVNLLECRAIDLKKQIEDILQKQYSNPPRVFLIPEIPEVICIDKLRNNIFHEKAKDNLLLRKIMIDILCARSVLRGAHIFAPGVLGMESGVTRNSEVVIFADLSGRIKKGANKFNDMSETVFIGIGTALMDRSDLYSPVPILSGVAITVKSTISNVPCIGDIISSKMILQNFPSIVCIKVLDPKPNEKVLDMCAAPGNKTAHIIELMHDEGVIVAFDKCKNKINKMQKKFENSKSLNIFCADSTKIVNDGVINENFIGSHIETLFDRILLDVPCSALGNRPILRSCVNKTNWKSLSIIQRRIFENGVQLLKPGGILVYSTCSITEDENENNVAWAIKKFPQLKLIPALPKWGGPGLPNLGLDRDQMEMVQRFGPFDNVSPIVDSIGFFIAKFVKLY